MLFISLKYIYTVIFVIDCIVLAPMKTYQTFKHATKTYPVPYSNEEISW